MKNEKSSRKHQFIEDIKTDSYDIVKLYIIQETNFVYNELSPQELILLYWQSLSCDPYFHTV